MLRRRLYYALKPFLPWGMRMAVRRIFARRKRERCKDIWPIDESTSQPPAGWTGWPDGKKFAFVLTHDVEGREGLAKVRQLAELEMKLGFRSSFNFIPEGPYQVPAELRAWLTANGFEVGVHDLHHDGRLFTSRRGFTEKAKRINRYLREWKASGYRSGFMLRNLDWLHDLDIQYDASTFDTDPFEPQAEGAGTIFPYWIPSPGDGIAKSKAASAESPNAQPTSHSSFASVSQSENCGQAPRRRPVDDPWDATKQQQGTPGGQPHDRLGALSSSNGQATTARPSQPLSPSPLPSSPASFAPATSTVHHPPSTGSRQGLPSEASAKEGYIELPYTLPQDSTLFLLLQEKSPEIWLRKLDWIAAHQGMALLNVHPDYVQFEDAPSSPSTYPVSHYIQFLEYLRERYCDAYGQILPQQLAKFAAALQPLPKAYRPKRVCMITHSFYESDNRVTRYAEALAARGDQVDVLSLRRSPDLPRRETINGVRVLRIQDRFGKSERSILSFIWPAVRFLFSSSARVTWRHARKPYDLLHVHNIPDFLVFAAWYPKLTGAKVILDIHDIVPEFFGSKFGPDKKSAMRLLRWMERLSAHFADHVIISNHLWLDLYTTRTRTAGKSSVFINNVDSRVFQPHLRTRHDGKLIILFPGGLQWHQGLDIALRSFVQVSRELPQAEFHIYGDGNMKPVLVALTAELGLNDKVSFFDPVRLTAIAQVMANADLGVVPKRADSFGNEAYSTKIMEFMSLGVPIVVSQTKIDRYYFNDSVVKFFESGNVEALAAAMLEVLRDADLRNRLIANAKTYAEQYTWESRKGDYLQLADTVK